MQARHWIFLLTVLATPACQVQNGVLCSYLNDNCGDDAGAGEGGSGEDGGPSSPPESPCDQIGNAVGQALVPAQNSAWTAWYDQGAVVGMGWAAAFPPQWSYFSEPATNAKTELHSPPPTPPDQSSMVIQDLATAQGYHWIQTEGVGVAALGWPEVGDTLDTHIIEQYDGSELVYALAPYDPGRLWWELIGENGQPFTVRGHESWTLSVWAGPAASNAIRTIDGVLDHSFRPHYNSCVPAEGADETGHADPAPGPEGFEVPPGTATDSGGDGEVTSSTGGSSSTGEVLDGTEG